MRDRRGGKVLENIGKIAFEFHSRPFVIQRFGVCEKRGESCFGHTALRIDPHTHTPLKRGVCMCGCVCLGMFLRCRPCFRPLLGPGIGDGSPGSRLRSGGALAPWMPMSQARPSTIHLKWPPPHALRAIVNEFCFCCGGISEFGKATNVGVAFSRDKGVTCIVPPKVLQSNHAHVLALFCFDATGKRPPKKR